MNLTTKLTEFAFNYFKAHDYEEDDNYDISCVSILSFSQVDDGFTIVFQMPHGLIYMLRSTHDDNVYFTKYASNGSSLYTWKGDD